MPRIIKILILAIKARSPIWLMFFWVASAPWECMYINICVAWDFDILPTVYFKTQPLMYNGRYTTVNALPQLKANLPADRAQNDGDLKISLYGWLPFEYRITFL